MFLRLLPILGTLAASARIFAADPQVPQGFRHIQSFGGIDEYRLESNGLQVLLKPDHSVPVVTLNVTFRVGSRNEVTGTTGATHILEHLMFKGSDAFNDAKGNSVKQFLERVGGSYNATTWTDRTHYYATIGKAHLPGYLAIEADRMRNLWLRAEDLASEMTVVRNEYERGENNPSQALHTEVTATAFQAHPYHHATIGWRSDIEKIRVDKLREFMNTFYWPNNATVVVVGDFDPVETLKLINKEYGIYPSSPKPIPEMTTEEPEQQGPRRVVLRRPGQLGTFLVAFKVPSVLHEDAAALDVLSSVFANGKNSRLYRSLVDKGLATGVGASSPQTRDPGLFTASASLTPGTTHDQVEQVMQAEFEMLKNEGVTVEEIIRAQRQRKVATAFGRDGSAPIASALNEWIAAGDWTQYERFEEAIARITPAEVQHVAKKYLVLDHSTTGWFVPILPTKK